MEPSTYHLIEFYQSVTRGAPARLAAACLAATLLAGCAAEPPQFRANLVDMRVEELKANPLDSKPELVMDAPASAPTPAGKADASKQVEEVYGLRMAPEEVGSALVEAVLPDKLAASAGIYAGDVITKIVVVEPENPDKKDEKPKETTFKVRSRAEAFTALLDKVVVGGKLKVTVDRQGRQQITDILLALFGTPDSPSGRNLQPIAESDKKDAEAAIDNSDAEGAPSKPAHPALIERIGFNLDQLDVSAGSVRQIGKRQYGLYRLHCAHCHGISGDGAGPTAAFLNPYPRDYRQGKFKFKSTADAAKPTRADLARILTEGVPGTAMPSFRVLPENEREALVEYVKYLSVRGETELKLVEIIARGEPLPSPEALIGGLPVKADQEGNLSEPSEENVVAAVMYSWAMADKQIVAPPEPPEGFEQWITYTPGNLRNAGTPPPELSSDLEARRVASIKRGRELFYGLANCFSCHGDSQLGDGQTTDYDQWFKWRKDLELKTADERDSKTAEFLSLGALPPRNIRPRDLRSGVYRGGRRPLDIYRRIFSGINGTPMPALKPGKAEPGKPAASEEDLWHLVHYVLSLPYEPLSQPPAASVADLHPSSRPANNPHHEAEK